MNGWLSPKAEFFPCAIGKHSIRAKKLIKRGTGETWVAIHPQGAFSERPLTLAQIEWLKKSLEDCNYEYRDMTEYLLEKQER